jgi:ketosteroid isomerase-like protein
MSEENVEVVRQLYDAVARRDAATVFALYAADVVVDATRGPYRGFGHGIYRGHEGLRILFRDYFEAWEHLEDSCEELIDAGGENVISHVQSRARGRASGAEVAQTLFGVWTIRDGKVVRVAWFTTRDDASEAAALEA